MTLLDIRIAQLRAERATLEAELAKPRPTLALSMAAHAAKAAASHQADDLVHEFCTAVIDYHPLAPHRETTTAFIGLVELLIARYGRERLEVIEPGNLASAPDARGPYERALEALRHYRSWLDSRPPAVAGRNWYGGGGIVAVLLQDDLWHPPLLLEPLFAAFDYRHAYASQEVERVIPLFERHVAELSGPQPHDLTLRCLVVSETEILVLLDKHALAEVAARLPEITHLRSATATDADLAAVRAGAFDLIIVHTPVANDAVRACLQDVGAAHAPPLVMHMMNFDAGDYDRAWSEALQPAAVLPRPAYPLDYQRALETLDFPTKTVVSRS